MAKSKKPSKKTPATRKDNGQFHFENAYRKKKWKTPEDLRADIQTYINKCNMNQKAVLQFGKVVMQPDPIPYTIEGLSLHLGVTRETLMNYQRREGYEPFFGVILEFRQYVLSNMVENALMGKSHSSFSMFMLKNNFGFEDKKEVVNSGETIVIERPQNPNKQLPPKDDK